MAAPKLIATIQVSKFIRFIYIPWVKLKARLTKKEPDMDKVMKTIQKHTTIEVSAVKASKED